MASSKLEFPAVPAPSPDLSLAEIFMKSSGHTHANVSQGSHFSPAYLAVLGILGAAIVLVIYYYCFVLHFNCFSGEQRRRHRQIINIGVGGGRDGELGGVSSPPSPLHMIKKGLDEEAIRSIPTCTYYPSQQQQQQQQQQHHHDFNIDKMTPYDPTSSKATMVVVDSCGKREPDDDELSDVKKNSEEVHNNAVISSDCAVCLGSFREAEILRQLPSCRHAFHMACVDRWLSSCSECPLCRTDVVAPRFSPPPSAHLEVLVGDHVHDLLPQLASHVTTLPRFVARQQVDQLPSTHPAQFQVGHRNAVQSHAGQQR